MVRTINANAGGGDGEFKRGWQIVLASFLGIGLGLSPMPFYTMGVFAPHLARAFGWTIGQVMGGLSMTTLMVLWAAPAVGLLAGKIGVRRVVLIALPLFGLAFMALGASTGSLPQYYATWALVAVVGAGTLPITWTKAVNDWFDLRKGLALGLSLMGTGLFGILCKPFLSAVIGAFGWRAGYVALGLLPIVIAWPAAWLLFRDTDTHVDATVRTTTPGGLTFAQTLRQWRFWLLAVALLPISFALSGPVPNLEVILRVGGVGPATILALTPLIGLSALIGRLAGGWLLDRFWAPAVAFVILGAPALSFWLLSGATIDPTTAAAAILLLGFALGVEYDVIAYFVARYFGMRRYATIYGVLYVVFALGSGTAPLIFGWDYDRHGSYHFSLTLAAFALVLAAAALLLLGRYRAFDDEPIAP
jgi:predicted MFS family arabinose efflux permease